MFDSLFFNAVVYLLVSSAACRVVPGSTWTWARRSAFSVQMGSRPPRRGWRATRSKRSTSCSWAGCPSTPRNSARTRPPPPRPLSSWPPSDQTPAPAARRASSLTPTSPRASRPAAYFATATGEPLISPRLLGICSLLYNTLLDDTDLSALYYLTKLCSQ